MKVNKNKYFCSEKTPGYLLATMGDSDFILYVWQTTCCG